MFHTTLVQIALFNLRGDIKGKISKNIQHSSSHKP